MATKPLTDEVLAATLAAVREHGNRSAAARALDIPRSTLDHRCNIAESRGIQPASSGSLVNVELPTFAEPGDIPVPEILDVMERRFERRAAAHAERKWYNIKMKSNEVVCVNFVGDPHIDSNQCNISLLRRDLALMCQPGMFGVSIGDVTDGDWPGRLMRLHAKSDTSLDTARRLADWLLNHSGVTWLAFIMGNHDLWGADADLMRARNIHSIPMSDWAAKWQISFPNGKRCRVISNHSFPGRSIWNTLHSNTRAAFQADAGGEDCHGLIVASGHEHNWAIHQEENEHREFVYWLVRSRGYKFMDEYAERLGHPGQQHGSTISAIIDPTADSNVRFTTCFADVAEAADYLAWKSSR